MTSVRATTAQHVDGIELRTDPARDVVVVVLARGGRDPFDGDPQIGHVLPGRTDDRHRKWPDRGRQLVAYLLSARSVLAVTSTRLP